MRRKRWKRFFAFGSAAMVLLSGLRVSHAEEALLPLFEEEGLVLEEQSPSGEGLTGEGEFFAPEEELLLEEDPLFSEELPESGLDTGEEPGADQEQGTGTETLQGSEGNPETGEDPGADQEQGTGTEILQGSESSPEAGEDPGAGSETAPETEEETGWIEEETETEAVLSDGAAAERITSDTTLSVSLGSDALKNYKLLNAALARADGEHMLTVVIAGGGSYGIDTKSAALKLRSYTTLDLNGSTLIRTGKMLNQNLIQNCGLDGKKAGIGGYDLSSHITVKNGTLDGGSGSTAAVNLVNIGHASYVTFSGVTVKNGYGSHLIEFSGCRDCLVENCTFDGFTQQGSISEENPSGEGAEAVQLDICESGVTKKKWNGAYYGDGTVCQDMVVSNCTFRDYPSGVGNHHTLYGRHSSGIVIRNNRFENTGDASVPAIWCYGFDNSTVSGNVISGNYTSGIRVSGGNVSVTGNTVTNAGNKAAIYVTTANSYVAGQTNTRKKEPVTGGSVNDNVISVQGTAGISVLSGSVLSSVSQNRVTAKEGMKVSGAGTDCATMDGNTVNASAGNGLTVTNSARVGAFCGNTVRAEETGILVSSSGKLENLGSRARENTIIAKEVGVCVTSKADVRTVNNNLITATNAEAILVTGASAGAVSGNTATAKKSTGISVTNKATVDSVEKNRVNNSGKYGIAALSSSKITYIRSNTVSRPGQKGIYVGNGTVTAILSNTVRNGKAEGIYVTATSGVISQISQNRISGCGGSGIVVSASGRVKEMESNQISRCKGAGSGSASKSGSAAATGKSSGKDKQGAKTAKAGGKVQKK